jgi:hypothetical protein
MLDAMTATLLPPDCRLLVDSAPRIVIAASMSWK